MESSNGYRLRDFAPAVVLLTTIAGAGAASMLRDMKGGTNDVHQKIERTLDQNDSELESESGTRSKIWEVLDETADILLRM